jgi:hypothetical protein
MSDNSRVDWYNRECRGDGCDTVMQDTSWRVYCNDCLGDNLAEMEGKQ